MEAARRRLSAVRGAVCPLRQGPSASALLDTARPLRGCEWGVEVPAGAVDLATCSRGDVEALGELAVRHGLVVIRSDRSLVLHGRRQFEITTWLSPVSGVFTGHQQHPEQQHPAVFRLSNDPALGVPGAGSAYHHDSMHLDSIPPFAIYHLQVTPSAGGQTHFAFADPQQLSHAEREAWLLLRGFHPGGTGVGVHPLLAESADSDRPYLYPVRTTHVCRGCAPRRPREVSSNDSSIRAVGRLGWG